MHRLSLLHLENLSTVVLYIYVIVEYLMLELLVIFVHRPTDEESPDNSGPAVAHCASPPS